MVRGRRRARMGGARRHDPAPARARTSSERRRFRREFRGVACVRGEKCTRQDSLPAVGPCGGVCSVVRSGSAESRGKGDFRPRGGFLEQVCETRQPTQPENRKPTQPETRKPKTETRNPKP